jgi:hypothetical protein
MNNVVHVVQQFLFLSRSTDSFADQQKNIRFIDYFLFSKCIYYIFSSFLLLLLADDVVFVAILFLLLFHGA